MSFVAVTRFQLVMEAGEEEDAGQGEEGEKEAPGLRQGSP